MDYSQYQREWASSCFARRRQELGVWFLGYAWRSVMRAGSRCDGDLSSARRPSTSRSYVDGGQTPLGRRRPPGSWLDGATANGEEVGEDLGADSLGSRATCSAPGRWRRRFARLQEGWRRGLYQGASAADSGATTILPPPSSR
uniref:Uncharacterized protein n=1 Tax=Arundo donax TaxID=35708 RepID=A0A0A8YU44_ARUDO